MLGILAGVRCATLIAGGSAGYSQILISVDSGKLTDLESRLKAVRASLEKQQDALND